MMAAGILMWTMTPASGAEDGVTVSTPAGHSRCPAVEISGRRVTGGCRVEAREAPGRFAALTLLGDHGLAECLVSFELRIGGSGELAATEVYSSDLRDPRALSSGVSEACGDVLACRRSVGPTGYPTPEDILPWSGRLIAFDGGLVAELDACFDTCMGRFEGPLSLDVTGSAERGWRIGARRAAAGESGFEVSGGWRLERPDGRGLAIEPVDRGGS